jgi:hypothetical protein
LVLAIVGTAGLVVYSRMRSGGILTTILDYIERRMDAQVQMPIAIGAKKGYIG